MLDAVDERERDGHQIMEQEDEPLTYTDYQSAIAGADFTALFDSFEKRTAFIEALRAGGEAIRELYSCRNELCLQCGKYHEAHKGACDGCKWKEVGA